MEMFTRAFLGLNGLIFLALGVNGLLDPVGHMEPFGVQWLDTSIKAEIRANYGGMHLAMAALFLWGAFRPAWRRAALATLTLFVAGLALGRGLSLLMDGTPNTFVLLFLAVEIAGAALGLWLLRRGATPATAAA